MSSITKYYKITAYTPSDTIYKEYIKVSGKTSRECWDTAQEMAAIFSNDLAHREYIKHNNTLGYPSYEEYLNECGWSVRPIVKTRYIREVNHAKYLAFDILKQL
jgi:hypothetical protein